MSLYRIINVIRNKPNAILIKNHFNDYSRENFLKLINFGLRLLKFPQSLLDWSELNENHILHMDLNDSTRLGEDFSEKIEWVLIVLAIQADRFIPVILYTYMYHIFYITIIRRQADEICTSLDSIPTESESDEHRRLRNHLVFYICVLVRAVISIAPINPNLM